MKGFKTISLTEETYERLRRYGYAGDSFDNVIKRVLDQLDSNKNKESNNKESI